MEERIGTHDPTPMRPLRLVSSSQNTSSPPHHHHRGDAAPGSVARVVGSLLAGSVNRGSAANVYDAGIPRERACGGPIERSVSKARGILIGGRYRIETHLGDGGMGSVYRAFDREQQQTVAVKVLKPRLIESQDRVARFRQEARALRLLKHPNSVRIFDSGRTPQGTLYFVMEYLEGYNLADMLDKRGPLTWQSAFKIGTQILRALREAHEIGIVHRDLKPENIFLCNARREGCHFVKVLDFGLAKVIESAPGLGPSIEPAVRTQAGYVFGTPRYMSPEQARSQPLDGRSDLYNVGLLLYQMMTGTPTYRDEDAIVVMAKHVRTRPELPSKRKPGLQLPRRAEAIVMQALEKRPERRFSSAATMLAALESCLQCDLAQVIAPAQQPPRGRAVWLMAALPLIALLGIATPLAQVKPPTDAGSLEAEPLTAGTTRIDVTDKRTPERHALRIDKAQPETGVHAGSQNPSAYRLKRLDAATQSAGNAAAARRTPRARTPARLPNSEAAARGTRPQMWFRAALRAAPQRSGRGTVPSTWRQKHLDSQE